MIRRSVFLMMGLAALATPAAAQDRPAKNRDTAAMLQQTAPIAPSTVTTAPAPRATDQAGTVYGRAAGMDNGARPAFTGRLQPGTVVPRDPDAAIGTRSSTNRTTGVPAAPVRMPNAANERVSGGSPSSSATPTGGDESDDPDGAGSGPFAFSAGATVTSDYVYRGYTQTDGGPAVQGYVGLAHESGLYGEIWASNVDFDDDEAEAEVDFLASYSQEIGPVTAEGGVAYYWYPGVDGDWDYNYTELFLTLYADMFEDAISMAWSAYYSPEFFGGSGNAEYLEWQTTVPVAWADTDLFDVNGTLGYQWIEDNNTYGAPDYFNWSAGLSRTFRDVLTASLTYYGTDVDDDDCDNLCEDRVVAALAVDL